MPYDINTPIRVGDLVTKEILGQIALEIDALHDGFITGTAPTGNQYSLATQALSAPSGIKEASNAPPAAFYTFSNNYTRRPPYLLVANILMARTTDTLMAGWIIRQPHIFNDPGRESTAATAAYNAWGTELAYNSFVNNIDGTNPPDGQWVVSGALRRFSMAKLIEDNVPRRFQYSGGTTKTVYDDFFHVALAPVGGTASNAISVYFVTLSIIGGR